jgi:hypothetical protein
MAERQAIGSPVAGEKPATSESKLSSMSDFPPADVPEARRFCLICLLSAGVVFTSGLLNEEERWRGLRS